MHHCQQSKRQLPERIRIVFDYRIKLLSFTDDKNVQKINKKTNIIAKYCMQLSNESSQKYTPTLHFQLKHQHMVSNKPQRSVYNGFLTFFPIFAKMLHMYS